MSYLEGFKLYTKNYKCFNDSGQGFNKILPINLIIGRNNSGKSALIDLVDFATNQSNISNSINQGHKNKNPEFFITKNLSEQDISAVFDKHTSGGGIPSSYYDYGFRWRGKPITFKLHPDGKKEFVAIEPSFDVSSAVEKFGPSLSRAVPNNFNGRTFKRMLAERDIKPEANDPNLSIAPDGSGITNLIQAFFNRLFLKKRNIVENELLNDLNLIFSSDSTFSRIFPQQLDGGGWEIVLEEKNKGAIRLSDSGSGLKTVIMVLAHLILIPALEGKPLSNYIFGFEELENNLHPGILRKLFLYIIDKILNNDSYVFITTHSSAVIDLVSKHKQTQIIHVKNDGEQSSVKDVITYTENNGVLDDLDVRASDLLQSNGLVWVEGPSDRTYINKWISIWSDGTLKEGIHYQCVFYGGRLLAHLQANRLDNSKKIEILNVNRNSFIVLDSDKENSKKHINSTKKRLVEEIEKNGGIAWVTYGREIENYIPASLIKVKYNLNKDVVIERFDKIELILDFIKKGEGDRFLKNKTVFAEDIANLFSKQHIDNNILDLSDRLTELCATIRSWNKLI